MNVNRKTLFRPSCLSARHSRIGGIWIPTRSWYPCASSLMTMMMPAPIMSARKWSALINAAAKYGDRLVIIANPDNGGCRSNIKDTWQFQKYAGAINKVRGPWRQGDRICLYLLRPDQGYRPLCRQDDRKMSQDVPAGRLGTSVDGIFLDENSSQVRAARVVQGLDKAIRPNGPDGLIVSNYGTQPAGRYLNRAVPVGWNAAGGIWMPTSETRSRPHHPALSQSIPPMVTGSPAEMPSRIKGVAISA